MTIFINALIIFSIVMLLQAYARAKLLTISQAAVINEYLEPYTVEEPTYQLGSWEPTGTATVTKYRVKLSQAAFTFNDEAEAEAFRASVNGETMTVHDPAAGNGWGATTYVVHWVV